MGCLLKSVQEISLEKGERGDLYLEMRRCPKFTVIFSYWPLETALSHSDFLSLRECFLHSTFFVGIYGLTLVGLQVF